MRLCVLAQTRLHLLGYAALVCLAAALAAHTLNGQTPAPAWQTYSYSTEGFSVLLPAAPQMSSRNVDTAAGPFELRSYVVEIGQVALFIGVCDYGDKVAGRDPDTMLQGAKQGALANSKSHLVREAPITLGIYRGLEFEAETADTHFYVRIYVVGHSLYQTLVVYPVSSPYPQTLQFLNSFQLIARTHN